MQSLTRSVEFNHSLKRQQQNEKRFKENERKAHRNLVFHLADKVFLASFQKRSKEEIDLLLLDLKEATDVKWPEGIES